MNFKDLLKRKKIPEDSSEASVSRALSSKSAKKIDFSFLSRLDFKSLLSGKKQLVGLDIGSHSLKLVEIIDGANGVSTMTRFVEAPLEKGIIVDGTIADLGQLVDAVKGLFKQAGLQGRGVVTSLSGHSVIVKKATFPFMEEQELREAIRDEAGKYLPFDSMDEVNFDFQVLGQNEYNPNQIDVIIVAAKKDIVEAYVEAIEMAGLSAVILDVDSFALETMYERNYDYEEQDIAVIVNIGASITNINVVKNATSIFTRDFTMGCNAIAEAISEQYGVPPEEAQRILVEGPEGDEAVRDDFNYRLLMLADPILSEIERSVDYFRSTYGDEDIKQIILAGGGASLPGIANDLGHCLGVPAEVVNPFQKIGWSKKHMDTDELERIGPIAAVAVGLALRRVGDK